MSQTRRTAFTVAFYVLVGGALLGILLQVFPVVLPDALAGRIARNSEGILLALVIAAWIQFARPRLVGSRREWPVTLAAGAVLLALGVALLLTDLPSRFRTLNETLLAAALVVPYLQARRPLPGRLAGALSAVLLAGVVAFNRTEFVTGLAETLAALVLVPIAFDVVDRGILDPGARTSRALRAAWYGFLVAAPILFSLLLPMDLGGLLGEAIEFASRFAEVFVCLLLVELFFAVVLGRTGRPDATVPEAEPVRQA
ncbi:hypothetical protein GCM10010531_24510 [Blastococcus jejuensis]|uniref:Uncharacterized protein n=1 Tax=Blastococcus jejuensis TaxID=351224 RepID=A0ABP6P7N3_9ACTN